MTAAGYAALIASVSAIVVSLYGAFKWTAWKIQSTPEQEIEKIDTQVNREEDLARKTGRP